MLSSRVWVWKFVYWPLVWALTLTPPLLLCGSCCRIPSPYDYVVRVSGAILLTYAFLLHGVAGRTLRYLGHSVPGKGFWPDRLVTKGIYSCMRHPQHLGLALTPIALALLFNSIPALVASGWAVAATLAFVLIVEEPDCYRKFGEDYMRYALRVPAFNINPLCLVKGIGFLRSLKPRLGG